MQFLRTLFWVVLAVFLAIIARNNWVDVTVALWGSLAADIKLPLLIAIAAFFGFLPTWLWLRARLWAMERRLAAASPPVTSTPVATPSMSPPATP